MYKNKIQILEIYENLSLEEQKKKKEKEITFILNKESINPIDQCYGYISNFFFGLRNDEELMFKIIQKSKIEDSQKCISQLLNNNFYENILSPSYIEDEYLALITRNLRQEINNLKQSNEPYSFLNNVIGNILEGLILKKDIQSYFNLIFKNIVEKIENGTDNRVWNFDVFSISNLIAKNKNEIKKDNSNLKNKNLNQSLNNSSTDTIDLSFQRENEKEKDFENNFVNKYIPDMTKKDLINLLDKQQNENIKTYLLKQLNDLRNDENLYSNSNFIYQVYKSEDSGKILNYYQKDFMTCIEFIIEIFNTLIENIHLIPFSIKCICKIISILIKEKFPNISIIELNAFIGEFFFGKIFKKILLRPDFYALISSFIISKHTIHNIKIIIYIINKLVSSNFFYSQNEPFLTPFNWFFLYDALPLTINFFDKLINVNLPSYIEKIINNPKNDNFNYNYFEENKNEFIQHKSICFCMNDFITLFNIVRNNEDYFFSTPNINGLNEENANKKLKMRKLFQLTIKKLLIGIHLESINKLLEKEQKENNKNFFLRYEISFNEQFRKLMKIEQKKSQPNLTLPELKEIKTDEDILNNNLIKIQNYFSKLLYNYRTLIYLDFSPGTTNDTISIINELIKYLKTGNFIIDNNIPSEWYAKSLLKLLKILPNNYKENDFELIYQKLINDLYNSIKLYDFELLSQIFERLKYTERAMNNINLTKIAFNEIEVNNLIKSFVETFPIEVEMKIKLSERYFEIRKLIKNPNQKQTQINDYIYYPDHKKGLICRNIFDFTNKFPSLIYYQQKQDYDLFELEKELHLPKNLENYYLIIKESMNKYYPFSEYKNTQNYEKIYYKITSYIMSRIYDKIFPNEPDFEDIKIYHNSIRLSWIEPIHMIKKNNYSFDNFLPETKEILQKVNDEKSPLQKLDCFLKLTNKIHDIIVFNNGNEVIGVEDSLPIFQFAVIKSQPSKYISNFKYMSMYLNKELFNSSLGHLLSQVNITGEFIKDINYNSLFNITNDEFSKKCNDAILFDNPIEQKI